MSEIKQGDGYVEAISSAGDIMRVYESEVGNELGCIEFEDCNGNMIEVGAHELFPLLEALGHKVIPMQMGVE